ncbi:MAG: hypothetical protein SVX43_18425, partial [Cyanobacteriota bacterium]|nr:hypothetical protein [Cyanobacteriota bacterium]
LFAIVISVALHLMLGWAIVRLLLVEGKASAQSKQDVISIETVAIAPEPQPSPQTPASPTESNSPASAKTPSPTEATPETPTPTPTRDRARGKSWRWYRPGARGQSQNSADPFVEERVESSSSASQQRDRTRTRRRVSSANGEPIGNESAASSNANAPRSASRPGTQRRVSSANGEPIWNDATSPSRSNSRASQGRVRRFSGAGSESLLGDASSSSGASSAAKSGDRGSGKDQSSSSSKTPPSAPPASNTSQNRGVAASLGTPRLTRPDRDVPDKLATPKQNSQTLSVLPLGIRLSGAVVLEVMTVIEPDGKATVHQTKVLSGAIARQKAEQLAKSIVEAWNFDPTLMAGQPVAQEYFIQLSLSPIAP